MFGRQGYSEEDFKRTMQTDSWQPNWALVDSENVIHVMFKKFLKIFKFKGLLEGSLMGVHRLYQLNQSS